MTGSFLRNRSKSRGLTLIEIMVATTIFLIVITLVAAAQKFINVQTRRTAEKTFAIQKAVQMLEELRAISLSGASAESLDSYDTGSDTSYVLTTRKDVTDPADPLSENSKLKYKRSIAIKNLENQPTVRKVYVRVYYAESGELAAETMGEIRIVDNLQKTSRQVFDIYLVGIENVGSTWIDSALIRNSINAVLDDLRARSPGLDFRPHWISRIAYGRDPLYTPSINKNVPLNTLIVPYVYFYPGPLDNTNDYRIGGIAYHAEHIGGRLLVDGVMQNGSSYSMADAFNYGVRYPDEIRLYNKAKDDALAANLPAPEISLRMLYEQLNTQPAFFKNAIVVNFHGEALPVIPMRNYSDAAKDPRDLRPDDQDRRCMRVVAHPSRLQYDTGRGMSLRVYSYIVNTDLTPWNDAAVVSTITVLLPDVNVDAANIHIRRMHGSSSENYVWQDGDVGTDFLVDHPQPGNTRIRLFKSPLRHAQFANSRGLSLAARLYGLEYIPCEIGVPNNFLEGAGDLSSPGDGMKNTARWTITIDDGVLPDGQYAIETRMGDDISTGVPGNQESNLSRTYAWIGQTPPLTEQYQFFGDPRHMPYSDVKANHGYNWYFLGINGANSPGVDGFTKTANGWDSLAGTGDHTDFDAPRIHQVFREGLMKSHAVFANSGGALSYFMRRGGTILDPVPMPETPWHPNSTTLTVPIETIKNVWGPADTFGRAEWGCRLIMQDGGPWVSLPWIGELYPDSEYANWQAVGNLRTGVGHFYRGIPTTSPLFDPAKGYFNPSERLLDWGASSFLNGTLNNDGTHLYRTSWVPTAASATGRGTALMETFNLVCDGFAAPYGEGMQGVNWPFPVHWNDPEYVARRTTIYNQSQYFSADADPSYSASGAYAVTQGSDIAYFAITGQYPTITAPATWIARYTIITAIQDFMENGSSVFQTNADWRTTQLPAVTISTATVNEFFSPTTIPIVWSTSWTRWDGQPYTADYLSGSVTTDSLLYHAKYSADGGRTWHFANTGGSTSAGAFKNSSPLFAASPFVWNVSGLGRGAYVIRVEAYRQHFAQHYSYDERTLTIRR